MTPEGQILNSILEWLAVKQVWHRRMNTGAIKADKRFFRFGSPGMADILCTLDTPGDVYLALRVVWIEVKAPKGHQSPAQIAFQKEVEKEGHGYVVARSIEDVEDYFKTL